MWINNSSQLGFCWHFFSLINDGNSFIHRIERNIHNSFVYLNQKMMLAIKEEVKKALQMFETFADDDSRIISKEHFCLIFPLPQHSLTLNVLRFCKRMNLIRAKFVCISHFLQVVVENLKIF